MRNLRWSTAARRACPTHPYIPVRRGFLYLVAILDWASRYVLAWRLSNTLDAGFCVEALEEARTRHGQPEIFNTDQGSQFTGFAFTGRLRAADLQISMHGRGRCMDHIFIERLWRSLKYEAVYLHDLRRKNPGRGLPRRPACGPFRRLPGPARHRRVDRLLQRRTATLGPRRKNPGRGLPRRPACGYDGQAATRLAHLPTGAATATGRSIQGDSGKMSGNRNTP